MSKMIFTGWLLMLSLTLFSHAQEAGLIQFEMKDQFDSLYSHEALANCVVILIGSDKDGSPFNSLWGKALHDSLQTHSAFEQIRFLPVADLRGVPFFMKGFVKGHFPKEKERRVLLDWGGKFAKSYRFTSKMSNIIIFDRNGELIYQTAARELHPETLAAMLQMLRKALEERA